MLLALSGDLAAFAVDTDQGLDRLAKGGDVRLALERDLIQFPVLVHLPPGTRKAEI